MNYTFVYDTIINNSKARILDGYVEKHHIVPKCMGGTDDKDNIAILTAREHFVCHQLLVKIFPNEYGLVKAANMMCAANVHVGRINNRLYEWLRIKLSLAMSESQMGEKNSQFGTRWVNNGTISKKVQHDFDIGIAWQYGRVKKHKTPPRSCIIDTDIKIPVLKLCKKCGCNVCQHPNICSKHQMINTLIKHFGFDASLIGTASIYSEYFRVVQLINDEYHINMLSTIDIAKKYTVPSTQRVDSIFKSLGIKKRTLSEALKSYVSK